MSSQISDIYSESVASRIKTAIDHWRVSRPGTSPDFIVVGERLKSQMLIAGLLEYRNGGATYGGFRILFSENTDTCMGVSVSTG